LQERLNELAMTDLSNEASEFDRLISSHSQDFFAVTRSLRLSDADVRRAMNRHDVFFKEIYEGARDEQGGNWFLADILTVEHRQKMMRLALENVTIEVNEHNRVFVRRDSSIGGTYMAGPAPPDSKPGITPGWIAVYYLSDFKQMILLAARSNEPLIWLPAPRIPESDFLRQRVAITKVISTEETRRKIAAISRDLVRGYGDDSYTIIFGGLHEFVASVYSRYVTSDTPENQVPSVIERLTRCGLYDLLGKDGDLLTALAMMSLRPVLGVRARSYVTEELKLMDIDYSRALTRFREIDAETGFRLIVSDSDENIWCMV
jgi:hypothetical protein